MITPPNDNPLTTPGGRLVLVITLLLIGIMAARTPLDSDLWWHLRSGQVMVETGRPLLHDVFSYTRDGAAWINHSWLSQLILYGLHQLAGYTGLSLWVVGLSVLSMGLLFFQMGGPAGWRALLLILAAAASAPVWSPRPQLTSLAVMALLGWLIQRWRAGNLRCLWVLPLMFCLWSNLHGGFSLGFLLLLAFFGGQVLDHILGFNDEAMPWKDLGRIALWSGLAALAVMVNPNGLDMWKIPFQTVGVGSLQKFIQEWASPDFHDPAQQPILLLVILLLAGVGFSRKRMAGEDWLSASGFLLMALLARRNIAPFALVSIPIIARYGWQVIQEWLDNVRASERFKRLFRESVPGKPHPVINLLLAGLLGLVVFGKLGILSLPAVVESASAGIMPQAAVDWLKAHPGGRMLSEYGWGGYLDWNLPEEQVFIDGRTDLFGDEIIGEWLQVVQADNEMEAILDKWGVQRVMLQPNRPAVKALISLGWLEVYQDPNVIILERSTR